jgi:DNA-binding transcriptional MocR family regulator
VRGGNGRSQPTQSLGREASPASCSSFGCRGSPSNHHLAFFESVERGAASVRLVKTSRSEQAYAALKRQILDQDLQPGGRLNIDALSRLLGVSSSPLREAMVRLEVEGLVVFTTNTSFSVAPLPDADQMRQLFEFRLLIETHCVRLGAARGEAEDVAALTQATDQTRNNALHQSQESGVAGAPRPLPPWTPRPYRRHRAV